MDSPPDHGPCEITITAPDRTWLEHFARKLVEDRLAAAAHVDMMATTYRWAGQVNQAIEARAVVHTDFRVLPHCVDLVKREHPYKVACVVAKSIVAGSQDYIRWIEGQVVLP